ncbi:uncharacterized protein METZ01_LOCUS254267 [marine metagenome]|uniref:Uncharacterized protein n=1 Tax=marine metagenome TaxID=408172 RepID=A0A382IRC9_9ZZZZ
MINTLSADKVGLERLRVRQMKIDSNQYQYSSHYI